MESKAELRKAIKASASRQLPVVIILSLGGLADLPYFVVIKLKLPNDRRMDDDHVGYGKVARACFANPLPCRPSRHDLEAVLVDGDWKASVGPNRSFNSSDEHTTIGRAPSLMFPPSPDRY